MDLFNGCFIVEITTLGPIIKRATGQFNLSLVEFNVQLLYTFRRRGLPRPLVVLTVRSYIYATIKHDYDAIEQLLSSRRFFRLQPFPRTDLFGNFQSCGAYADMLTVKKVEKSEHVRVL